MLLAEPIAVALRVGEALDALGVDWLVGGSVASSLHGIPRATQDIDLVADLAPAQIAPLVAALEVEFYIDADMIRGAIRRRSCFNLIHLATMTKVDVFTLGRDPLSIAEMHRRQHIEIDERGHRLPLASPEDIILQKLDRYRRGAQVSERQWRDVLGVLKVRGHDLDLWCSCGATSRASRGAPLGPTAAHSTRPEAAGPRRRRRSSRWVPIRAHPAASALPMVSSARPQAVFAHTHPSPCVQAAVAGAQGSIGGARGCRPAAPGRGRSPGLRGRVSLPVHDEASAAASPYRKNAIRSSLVCP